MVRHLVAWNFQDSLSKEEREEAKKEIRERLEAAAAVVDGVVDLKVTFNEFESSNRDILLFADFVSEDALNAYQVHPEHLKAKEYIVARTKDRACFDYSVSE